MTSPPLDDPHYAPLPWSVCVDCGSPFERDRDSAQCDDCYSPARRDYERHGRRRGKTAARGYGSAWQRLSRRARDRQPFCSDCGSPDDLSADHSTEAWRRLDAGLTVRLRDIDVVCIRCNAERGAARGERATDKWRDSADRIGQLAKEFDRTDDLDR